MFPKVILIDVNSDIISAWKKYFRDSNVEIVHMDFKTYMDAHGQQVDAVVSPANSFGLMDGGYDLVLREYFGRAMEQEVQQVILKEHFGEQTVGTAFSVMIPGTEKLLIHSPSMRVPSPILDANVIYNCMRSTLIEAIRKEVKCVLIPAFGGLTGRVEPEVIALKMWGAYVQLKMPPMKIGWDTVINYTDERLWEHFSAY